MYGPVFFLIFVAMFVVYAWLIKRKNKALQQSDGTLLCRTCRQNTAPAGTLHCHDCTERHQHEREIADAEYEESQEEYQREQEELYFLQQQQDEHNEQLRDAIARDQEDNNRGWF